MSGNIALSVNEKNVRETAGSVSIAFSRTGDASRPVTISYEIQANTAQEGLDFEGGSGTVRIAAGERTATLDIDILDDARSEATEDFAVAVLAVSSGNLTAPRTTRVNILDDENPVVVPPEPPLVSDYNVREVPLFNTGGVIDVEFMPGNEKMMMVLFRSGEIRLFNTRTESFLPEPFYEFGEQARSVFSMEVHPNFPEEPYVYAYYKVDPPDTAGQTGNAGPGGMGARFLWLVRMEADPAADYLKIIPGSETILLGGAGQSLDDISGGGEFDFGEGEIHRDLPGSDTINLSPREIRLGLEYRQDYIKGDAAHYGGGMAFGPDGMLYLGIGDGAAFNFGDPRALNVQDVDALNGKILRIDPITGRGLRDNPFAEPGDSLDLNRTKVYQLGARNPFTISFSRDGDLIISDTGQSSWEEINIGAPGANFGWPFYEGADGDMLFTTPNFRPENGFEEEWEEFLARGETITPAWRAFSHRDLDPGFQVQAITGGQVDYKGNKYPGSMDRYYFFSDYSDGEVFAVDLKDRSKVAYLYTRDGFAPIDFELGPDGYVYYVALEGREVGRLEISSKSPTSEGDILIGRRGDDRIGGRDGEDVVFGRGGEDRLFGGEGKDDLHGQVGADRLVGGQGADGLYGGKGADILLGGRGRDAMEGGRGDDTFRFGFAAETASGRNRDVIRDFKRGDLVDLSGIDANENRARDQAFRYIRDEGFGDRAGELRYDNGVVRGDADGDGVADFSIAIANEANLRLADFLL